MERPHRRGPRLAGRRRVHRVSDVRANVPVRHRPRGRVLGGSDRHGGGRRRRGARGPHHRRAHVRPQDGAADHRAHRADARRSVGSRSGPSAFEKKALPPEVAATIQQLADEEILRSSLITEKKARYDASLQGDEGQDRGRPDDAARRRTSSRRSKSSSKRSSRSENTRSSASTCSGSASASTAATWRPFARSSARSASSRECTARRSSSAARRRRPSQTTLGTSSDEQKIDALPWRAVEARFMLHYNFPRTRPARRSRSASSRREIGHGALAERAIARMMPDEDRFQRTISVVGEIFESNGSSSMASVCGILSHGWTRACPSSSRWPASRWASSPTTR